MCAQTYTHKYASNHVLCSTNSPPPPLPRLEHANPGTGTGGYEADEGLTPAQIRKREKRLAQKAKKSATKVNTNEGGGGGRGLERGAYAIVVAVIVARDTNGVEGFLTQPMFVNSSVT